MLLSSNTNKVIELVKMFEDLKEIDKLRLAIHLLENIDFATDFGVDSIIALLKEVLCKLDPNYSKTITNFAVYKNLLFLSAKYMELDYMAKKKFSVEMLFSIYETNFDKDEINKLINEKLDIYNYCYSLNLAI